MDLSQGPGETARRPLSDRGRVGEPSGSVSSWRDAAGVAEQHELFRASHAAAHNARAGAGKLGRAVDVAQPDGNVSVRADSGAGLARRAGPLAVPDELGRRP